MSILSLLWKNLRKCIFVDEIDEIYENEITATFFGLYCLSGGFCFHPDVRQGFRKFWIYFNALNFIVVNVSCLYFLFDASVQDYFGWLIAAVVMIPFWLKFGIYYWISSMRDYFPKFLDTIDDKETKYGKYVEFCTVYLKKSQMKMVKIFGCILVLCVLCNNWENFVDYENYFVNFYPIYFPVRRTFPLRMVIRIVQGVTVLPEIITFPAFPTLLLLITQDIYSRFQLLSLFLRDASYSARLSFDEIWNLEIAMEEERISNTLSKKREINAQKELALDGLKRKMIIFIERHRDLYSIAKSIAEKLQWLYNLISAGVNLVAVIEAYSISLIIDPTQLQRSLIFILVTFAVLFYWLTFCLMGEMFQKMNEIIETEIYESPWYLLKPKDRRLVHTFLTIVQRPISIVAWKVFPMNLSTFPETLNTVYSNIQNLRTLQSHRRKYCT